MKRKVIMNMKRLLTAAFAVASMALTSISIMATAPLAIENGIQPVDKVVHRPVDKQAPKGIEYTKVTELNEDGSSDFFVESWIDPVTLDRRIERLAMQEDGTIAKFGSFYLLDKGTKWVEVLRDKDGKAISGKYCILLKQEGESEGVDTWQTFADLKYIYSNSQWENKGTEKSENKKDLVNLFGTNILKDNIQPPGSKVVMNEYVQIEADTGLPVKLSVYSIEKGVKRFQYASAYEHKYIEDDSIFDLTGIPMKQYTKMQWIHGIEY